MNWLKKYLPQIKGLVLIACVMTILLFIFSRYDSYGDEAPFATITGTILVVFVWVKLSKKFNL